MHYWFRVLIGSDLSMDNIFKIALKFATEYEKFVFNEELSNPALSVEEDGRVVRKVENNSKDCGTFGTVVAKPGHSYHWQIKVIEITGNHLNIGIVEAKEYEQCLKNDTYWYNRDYGYSYWAGDGKLYHANGGGEDYGDPYEAGDIIDLWLDLNKNVNELSFAKNNKKYGKAANVKESTEYKLGIAMYGDPKKIELLSFEMD